MKFRTLFACLLAIVAGLQSAKAQEAYAVYTDNNTTLTFYYDNQKASRDGMSVGPFNAVFLKSWFRQSEAITTVKFDDSFASYTELTSTAYWFAGCKNLTNIEGINNLKTDNVTSMTAMFENCSSLTSLDLSSFNTSNVTDMHWMFNFCSGLTSLDVSHFNTANVTDMGYMFQNCSSLTSLDLSNFNTSNVTNMVFMFLGCSSLTSLDVSSFNTSNVTGMVCMFSNCSSLKTLDVSGFNTSNVTNMYSMFSGCSSLKSLDLSNFNTENVKDMNSMFRDCSSLTSIDVSGFNTEKVTRIYSMFSGCSSLTSLDVSNFNTEEVLTMYEMFRNCSSLTSLDLSNFNTEKVSDMNSMFRDCSSLKTIYASNWNMNAPNSGYNMFMGCVSLVGGNGTTYDSNHIDNEYARIDKPGQPGYFTDLVEDYSFSVYETKVTNKNKNDILGNGVFSYDPASKTLTVHKSYSSNLGSILENESLEGLVVNIPGNVTLSAPIGFYSYKDISITGPGHLTVSTKRTTTDMMDCSTLVIKDIAIDAESDYWGIAGEMAETLIIQNSTIKAKGPDGAICDFNGGITLTGCKIVKPIGGYVKNGDVVDASGNLATEVVIARNGDANLDGVVDIADVVAVLNAMANDQDAPQFNVNGDAAVDIADVVAVLNIMAQQ